MTLHSIRNDNERRRFPRLDIRVLNISLVIFPVSGDAMEIFPQDIGLGGISFRTDYVLRPGDQLKLMLKFPSREMPEVAIAEVVWTYISETLHSGGRIWYDVGVSFCEISQTSIREIIRLYVDMNNKDE